MDAFGRTFMLPILRAMMARTGAAVMAVVVLTAFFAGGTRYFYCPVMKVAMTTSCCAGERVVDPADTEARDALVATDCCQARRIAKVPSASIPLPHDYVVAPLASRLPAVTVAVGELAARPVTRFTHPVRAGPPTAGARRARLMIWTC